MPWVRVDDAFYDNPKFTNLSNAAVGAWVKMLAWASRNLTDGEIPTRKAGPLAARRECAELVSCGLLEETTSGWRLHDYLDYQPDAAAVGARRQKERDRWSRRKNPVPIEDHSAPTPRGAPPYPIPVPIPKPIGTESGAPAAPAAPKPAKRPTQLGADFELTAARSAKALELGVPANRVDAEFDKFCAYHQSNANKKADWDAAWRYWLRNYRGPRDASAPSGGLDPSVVAALAKAGGKP